MLSRPLFDIALGFYTVAALGLVRILWISGLTPMDASVRRLRVPKIDETVALHSSSDVGVI